MTLSERDNLLVRSVAKFGQLTPAQIHELAFSTCKSRTSSDNRLRALTKSGYLARVELRRVIGGSKGGAGCHVYQLGRRGFQLYNEGVFRLSRNVNYHQLLLADTYLEVLRLARNGVLSIDGMATGDDSVAEFDDPKGPNGRLILMPDMRLDVTRRDGARFLMWLEVDMATEGRRQIRDKLGRYWRAVEVADPGEWPELPRCVWVACDEERAKELRWIIDQGKDEDSKRYFKVCTLHDVQRILTQ